MDAIIKSILLEWNTLNPTKSDLEISNIAIKYQNHKVGIYTLYFDAGKEKIRIKALINPYNKIDTLVRYLQSMFGVKIKNTWKIIDMT